MILVVFVARRAKLMGCSDLRLKIAVCANCLRQTKMMVCTCTVCHADAMCHVVVANLEGAQHGLEHCGVSGVGYRDRGDGMERVLGDQARIDATRSTQSTPLVQALIDYQEEARSGHYTSSRQQVMDLIQRTIDTLSKQE